MSAAKILKRYALITVAGGLFALVVIWVFVPNLFTVGGFTGIAQIINHFLPMLPVGIVALVLNIPLLILGWRKIGRDLLISSLYATAVSSLMIDVLASLYTFPAMDPILACIYGGIVVGIGCGVLLHESATTGGTEMAARLLKLKFQGLSIGSLCLALDVAVTLGYALCFRDLSRAMYGIVALYILSLLIDRVVYGPNAAKVAYIISDHHEELTRRLESRTSPSVEHPTADEVLERSYALAARYFPNGTADGREPVATSVPATERPAEQITVVRPVTSVVSTLALPDTLPDIPRNRAFRTAVGPDTTTPTGMIRACIAGEQRIAAGERVRLRLLDRVQAGETLLPEGTIIYGTATISGQRLGIRVQSLASDAGLLTVNLTAYDTDGLPGLFIPDAAERTALKEAAASAGNNLGSGITVTRGAGQQIASDLTRSLLSGGTKYLSAKLREVRITLKAGHTLFLVSEQ